jgi:hypothetical protein
MHGRSAGHVPNTAYHASSQQGISAGPCDMLWPSLGRWRNGRRSGLKIRFGETRVRVRVPPALPREIRNYQLSWCHDPRLAWHLSTPGRQFDPKFDPNEPGTWAASAVGHECVRTIIANPRRLAAPKVCVTADTKPSHTLSERSMPGAQRRTARSADGRSQREACVGCIVSSTVASKRPPSCSRSTSPRSVWLNAASVRSASYLRR